MVFKFSKSQTLEIFHHSIGYDFIFHLNLFISCKLFFVLTFTIKAKNCDLYNSLFTNSYTNGILYDIYANRYDMCANLRQSKMGKRSKCKCKSLKLVIVRKEVYKSVSLTSDGRCCCYIFKLMVMQEVIT